MSKREGHTVASLYRIAGITLAESERETDRTAPLPIAIDRGVAYSTSTEPKETEMSHSQSTLVVGQAGAVPWLIHLLQDEDAGVRGSSAEGLGRLCAMEAIPKLELLLQNEEDSVAKVIVKGVLKNLKIY